MFKPQHPIVTDDGRLANLGELRVGETRGAEGIPKLRYGTAEAEISWGRSEIGEEAYKYLEAHGFNPSSSDFEMQIHVRSFLARIGLDAEILSIEFSDDILVAKLELKFLVDQELDGNILFPLEQGLRGSLEASPGLRLANLILIPREASALNASQIENATSCGELRLPSGWSFDEQAQEVRLPLGPNQYQVGGIRALGAGDWSRVLRSGKREIRLLQETSLGGNLVRPGLDIRDIHPVSAGPDMRVILSREVGGVVHSNSRHLVICPELPRHVELQTPRQDLRADQVRVGARFFRQAADSSTRVAKDWPETLPQPVAPGTKAATLDEVLIRDSSVVALIEKVEANVGKINGIIIGPNGAFILPKDRDASLESWATCAAIRGKVLDSRPIDRVGSDLVRNIAQHPGVAALVDMLKTGVTHYHTHIFIGQVLPGPEVVKRLAKDSGAGIGTFIATELRDLTSKDEHLYSPYSLLQNDLAQYRQFAEQGIANVYWLPPRSGDSPRQAMKLVGSSFVRVGLESYYRQLDFVLALYCSGEEFDNYSAEFTAQITALVDQLDRLRQKVAIATSGAGHLPKHVAKLVDGRQYIQAMNFVSLVGDSTPDFGAGIITICSPEEMRAPHDLVANMADARLILNGSLGTSSGLLSDLLAMKLGANTPAPVGLIDLNNQGLWKDLRATLAGFASGPTAGLSTWVPRLISGAQTVPEFFVELLQYLDRPVDWMREKGVPSEIQRLGLQAHLRRAALSGRRPADFLKSAFQQFRLG